MADLRYKALLDDSDYRKKFAALQRDTGKDMADMFDRVAKTSGKNMEEMLKRINTAVSKATSGADSVSQAKSTAAATDAVAKAKIAAANATKQEREEQLAFMQALRQSRLEIQANREAQAKANADLAAGRVTIQEYRKEVARLNLEEKKRRQAESAARKALADNSEYQKLNRALGELRRQSKDVLAEMFRLERQGKKNSVAYQELANKARGLVAQTNILDRGIKRIDTSLGLHQRHVGDYGRALDAISPQFARLNSQLAMMGVNLSEVASQPGAIKQLGAAFVALGKQALMFLVSPIGLVITALASLYALIRGNASTVIEFNAGLLNVSKTTGLAGRDLDKFSDSLIGLSRQLQVVSTDKLLEYATVAGQLGVKGTANILAFTEALAKLETASDITGEEGGSNIARLLTLVDGGVQNVKAFGDEIVNLGNNFAATEAEILENATQIAQNVGIYKIGRQEVLAFATATKSVGIEAELVGSTFGRTLGQFDKIIRTGKGLADLLEIVGGNEKDLAQRFKTDASGVFVDYIRGLNNINKAGGSVNAALAKTGVVAIRDQRVIASLATNGFDVLTDAINKSSDAVGAMDQEFRTKSDSLENQIGRIKTAWNNLVLSIENGQGVLGRSAAWLSGVLADTLEWVNKLVTATSTNEFITRFNPFSGGQAAADATRDANTALRETADVIEKVRGIDLSKSSTKVLTEQIALMDGALQSARKQIEDTDAAIKKGLLKEGSGQGLKRATSDLEQLKRAAEQLLSVRPSETTTTVVPPVDPEVDAAAKRARETALKGQRDLQKQIDEMNRASLKATLDKDEQEVESVRDKYRKIRQTIDEFRRDPKNKGMAVDASGLTAAEAREVAEVRYRQDTTALMKELGIQRQLWQDYEAWRLELGSESADKRYEKELDAIKSYRSRLDQEIAKIGGQLTASIFGGPVTAATLTGAEKERLDNLIKERDSVNKEISKRDADNLKRLLTDYASYEKKRERLREKANEEMIGMDEETRKIRQKALEDDLAELYKAEIEGNEELIEFLKTADTAGSSVALKAIKHGKDFVMKFVDGIKDPAVKAKLKKELEEYFDGMAAGIETENFGNVVSLVEGFGQLVESATQFDGTLGNAMKTIGAMVSQVGQLAQTLGQTIGKLGGGLSKAGGIAGIVGAVVSVVGGIIEAIEAKQQRRWQKAEEERQHAQDYQIKQLDATTKILEYQLSIIKDIYGVGRVTAYTETIRKSFESVNNSISKLPESQFLSTGDSRTDRFADLANQLGSIDAIDRKIAELRKKQKGNWLFPGLSQDYAPEIAALEEARRLIIDGSIKDYQLQWKSIDDITQDEITNLRKLLDEGRFDEVTAAHVSNIIEQYELWKQAMNELNAELTGTTFQSITDEIVGMFSEGKTAAEDFGESFEKIMQNAILQSFKRKYLEEGLQGWYDEFAAATRSDDELSKTEIDELQNSYNDIINNAREQFNLIKEATGVDFGDGLGKPESGLKSGIERMTEQTASELTGLYRAMYDLTKSNGNQSLALMNSQLVALNSINVNTANTVLELRTAVGFLSTLVINTTPQTATNYVGRP